MSSHNPQPTGNEWTDYEGYCRNFKEDESLVSLPEGGDYHSTIMPMNQIWTRENLRILSQLSRPHSSPRSNSPEPEIAEAMQVYRPQEARDADADVLVP